ncbi:MAG: L-threonine 3-dehydrogenase [Herpetosiphonaceae bacterium]|nr:L-threonine 3-dehydrogenase [Herpetosiphonaceae bacterium]
MNGETMRGVQKATAAPGAVLATVPIPIPARDEVLIRVRATTICGTDLHIYKWDPWAQSRLKPPMVFGHELAGDIVQVGVDVTTAKVGDFVSAETHIVCGYCYQCRTGASHICRNVEIIGVDRPGCFAEYIAVPAVNIWHNDPTMPPALAAAQEPFGNAVHTALATNLATRNVLVTGCGPIGLFAIGIARAAGANQIFATDINPKRLEMARTMGATHPLDSRDDVVRAILNATGGEGVDVLLEMSGHPSAIDQGFRSLRYGGFVSILGLPANVVPEFDLANHIVFKGATVYGVSGRKMFETWYQTRALVGGNKVDLRPIITHHLPLEEFETAFELMLKGEAAKVALYPHGVEGAW